MGPQEAKVEGVNLTATGDGQSMAEALGARIVNGDLALGPGAALHRAGEGDAGAPAAAVARAGGVHAWAHGAPAGGDPAAVHDEVPDHRARALARAVRGRRDARQPARRALRRRAGPRPPGACRTSPARWPSSCSTARSRSASRPGRTSSRPRRASPTPTSPDYRRNRPDVYTEATVAARARRRLGMQPTALQQPALQRDRLAGEPPFIALGPVRSVFVHAEGGLAVDAQHRVLGARAADSRPVRRGLDRPGRLAVEGPRPSHRPGLSSRAGAPGALPPMRRVRASRRRETSLQDNAASSCVSVAPSPGAAGTSVTPCQSRRLTRWRNHLLELIAHHRRARRQHLRWQRVQIVRARHRRIGNAQAAPNSRVCCPAHGWRPSASPSRRGPRPRSASPAAASRSRPRASISSLALLELQTPTAAAVRGSGWAASSGNAASSFSVSELHSTVATSSAVLRARWRTPPPRASGSNTMSSLPRPAVEQHRQVELAVRASCSSRWPLSASTTFSRTPGYLRAGACSSGRPSWRHGGRRQAERDAAAARRRSPAAPPPPPGRAGAA